MSSTASTGEFGATIRTQVPERLDRLPWSRFHWRVVVGLGSVWILDGLEVTMVGSVAVRLTQQGSGAGLTAGEIGIAGAVYVLGACLGALVFGRLTDRYGRKKLFLVTLGLYLVATVATGFTFSAWYFFLARFLTGAGIGGEYAAINSAIDELIPARVRGRVDLVINGTYWLGSAGGAALALFFLSTAVFPAFLGWRLAFGLGAVLGIVILLVRRHVPESPRWLFIHGREDEAEALVDGIEEDVRHDTGQELSEPDGSLTVRQRGSVPLREVASTALRTYPKRTVLGLALFVGQAFLYNGVTFNLGTLLGTFYDISAGVVPVFVVVYALGNFLGAVLLGRLFDTVGRKPMIALSYLGAAVLTVPLAIVFGVGAGGPWLFEVLVVATFFLATAGASAAYLTVSEIFPMETRALAIALFYAVGTAVGGVVGPVLFGTLVGTGHRGVAVIAFVVSAAVMAVGGLAEILFGVRAEQASLEDVARPLSAQAGDGAGADAGADAGGDASGDAGGGVRREARDGRDAGGRRPDGAGEDPDRGSAAELRARAEDAHAEAAERRAAALDRGDGSARRTADLDAARADLEAAAAAEERATAVDARIAGQDGPDGRGAADEHRVAAAEERANALDDRAAALAANGDGELGRYLSHADRALDRARAHEQRALAADADAAAGSAPGPAEDVERARAESHRAWAAFHEASAAPHGTEGTEALHATASAAEERLRAAEHRAAAAELRDTAADRAGLEDRIRDRAGRRAERERAGLRRFRPGPGSVLGAQRRASGVDWSDASEAALDEEIRILARAVDEHGPVERAELARVVGARYWGPGRFRAALLEAVGESRVRRLGRRVYGPPDRAR